MDVKSRPSLAKNIVSVYSVELEEEEEEEDWSLYSVELEDWLL